MRAAATSNLEATPIALLLRQPSELTFQSPKVRLCEFTSTFSEVEAAGQIFSVAPRQETACYALTNVSLRQLDAGRIDGEWTGLDPGRGTLRLDQSAGASSEARSLSLIATDESVAFDTHVEEAPPEAPVYYRKVTTDHLRIRSESRGEYNGVGALKILGPDVELQANENTTVFRTGMGNEQGALRERTHHWLYLTFDEGHLSFATEIADAALAALSLQSNGRIEFTARTGSLIVGKDEYVVNRTAQVFIDGKLSATLTPKKAGQLAMRIEGEIHATSLATAAARVVAPTDARFPWWPLLAVATFMGACGTVYALRHRRANRQARIEGAVEAADAAESREEYLIAADRLAMARVECRGDDALEARLAGHQGMCLIKAGELRQAMAVFDAGATHDPTGDMDRWAALCAIRAGDIDAAEMFLARCLDRPGLLKETVDEVDQAPDFEGLRQRASIREALYDARQRLEASP